MIKKILKMLGKIIFAVLAIWIMILIPVFASLLLCLLSGSVINIESFFGGAVCSSVFSFMFYMFLVMKKIIKVNGEKENAENTEQEN